MLFFAHAPTRLEVMRTMRDDLKATKQRERRLYARFLKSEAKLRAMKHQEQMKYATAGCRLAQVSPPDNPLTSAACVRMQPRPPARRSPSRRASIYLLIWLSFVSPARRLLF